MDLYASTNPAGLELRAVIDRADLEAMPPESRDLVLQTMIETDDGPLEVTVARPETGRGET